jgi:hypothetical protein
MGILEKIGLSVSSEERLLDELTDLADRNQALVDRLRRHTEICPYPSMKQALERLAAKEAAHVNALKAILTPRGRWVSPRDLPSRNGANSWERITGDLELLSRLSIELGRQAIHWEAVNPEIAERLHALVDEDAAVLGELRKLALKSDPQALD